MAQSVDLSRPQARPVSADNLPSRSVCVLNVRFSNKLVRNARVNGRVADISERAMMTRSGHSASGPCEAFVLLGTRQDRATRSSYPPQLESKKLALLFLAALLCVQITDRIDPALGNGFTGLFIRIGSPHDTPPSCSGNDDLNLTRVGGSL